MLTLKIAILVAVLASSPDPPDFFVPAGPGPEFAVSFFLGNEIETFKPVFEETLYGRLSRLAVRDVSLNKYRQENYFTEQSKTCFSRSLERELIFEPDEPGVLLRRVDDGFLVKTVLPIKREYLLARWLGDRKQVIETSLLDQSEFNPGILDSSSKASSVLQGRSSEDHCELVWIDGGLELHCFCKQKNSSPRCGTLPPAVLTDQIPLNVLLNESGLLLRPKKNREQLSVDIVISPSGKVETRYDFTPRFQGGCFRR